MMILLQWYMYLLFENINKTCLTSEIYSIFPIKSNTILVDSYLGGEKKICKETIKCIFTIWLVWPCPKTTLPAPGIKKFTTFVDPFLVIITIYLVCLAHAREWIRFLKKYINFTLFTPKLSPLGKGHKNHYFLSPYPTDATHRIW